MAETANMKKGNAIPTQSVYLDGVESPFEKAVEWYEKTGRRALQWQKSLLQQIMTLNEEGLWTHTKFGYSVPRRNGKNEIIAMREFWALMEGERVLHTAHRTTTSHSSWERLLELLDRAGVEYRATRAVGRETVELVGTGGRIDFRTRSPKGGLGEGFDLLVIDEAQEYTPEQESALKYVVTDSGNPQTLMCGTPPTPHSTGTLFTAYRKNVLYGQTENSGWAEWSVPEPSDIRDRNLWYETNPSLGYILTERAIADEIGPDETDFNIQRLGLWLRYNQKSAISENEWNNLYVKKAPNLVGKLFVGVKYGQDGKNVSVAVAAKTTSGQVFVEVIDCKPIRSGNEWIVNFLSSADVQEVVIDGANGQSLLAADMKNARIRKPPVLPTVKEIIVANAVFEAAIHRQSLCHMGQPSLGQVVTNSEKRPIGSNGGFGYRSQLADFDVVLIDSIMLAHWSCAESKPVVKQQVYY